MIINTHDVDSIINKSDNTEYKILVLHGFNTNNNPSKRTSFLVPSVEEAKFSIKMFCSLLKCLSVENVAISVTISERSNALQIVNAKTSRLLALVLITSCS